MKSWKICYLKKSWTTIMEIIYFESDSGKRLKGSQIFSIYLSFLKTGKWKLILKSIFQEKYLWVGLKQGQD